MPARPAVPDVLKVEFLWNQAGVPAANVRYVLYSGGPPDPADCLAIAEELDDAWWTPALSAYPASTVLEGVKVTDLTSDTGAESTYADGRGGSSENEACPANCCVLINHTIGRRYRGGHPRTYMPAPNITALESPSTWISDIVTAFTAHEAAYALAASTYTHGSTELVYNVNVSYVSGGEARVDPVIDQITGSVVSGLVRTQRRRITASTF